MILWETLQNYAIRMRNQSGGLIGTPTIGSSDFWIQSGSFVFSGGASAFSFPTTFPNGLVMVVACNGDTSAAVSTIGVESYTTSGCVFRQTGASGGVRVNWIAIGW